MSEEKEKRYKQISIWTAFGLQVAMLILFYFLIAWKEAFPPIPTYGIELSFGIEDAGESEERNDSNLDPSEEDQEEVLEESSEEVIPVTSADPDVIEPVSEVESPDVQPVLEEKPVPTPIIDEKKTEIKPQKTIETSTKSPTSQVETKKVDPEPSKGANKLPGTEGEKEGTIDGRALYGNAGAEGGASLAMAGWVWDSKPAPDDSSSESGKIVYRIKVDAEGYLTGIELISSTISPQVERRYRQSVERLSFTKISEGPAASTSIGEVTFIIRTK